MSLQDLRQKYAAAKNNIQREATNTNNGIAKGAFTDDWSDALASVEELVEALAKAQELETQLSLYEEG